MLCSRGPVCRGVLVAGVLALLMAWPSRANAFERQWRLGGDFGYAFAGFPGGGISGFGGGAHLAYGISDAFNLRFHTDVTAFDLPAADDSAIMYGGALGAEYVVDILQWVPYIGAMAGVVDVHTQSQGHRAHLSIEFPVGLGYQLSRSFTLGFEGRYRLLLLGTETSPNHNMTAFGFLAYTWGY